MVRLVTICLCLFASPFLFATDNISCSGTVSLVGLHSPNGVYVKLSSMNTQVQVCNLGASAGASYPIPAEQCKAIYSTLLTAYASGKPVALMLDNVTTGTNCTNFQAWELATARWVGLQN